MATIYLSKEITLSESECEEAEKIAIKEFSQIYKKLEDLIPSLQLEVNNFYPNATVESSGFEPTLVFCEDWR